MALEFVSIYTPRMENNKKRFSFKNPIKVTAFSNNTMNPLDRNWLANYQHLAYLKSLLYQDQPSALYYPTTQLPFQLPLFYYPYMLQRGWVVYSPQSIGEVKAESSSAAKQEESYDSGLLKIEDGRLKIESHTPSIYSTLKQEGNEGNVSELHLKDQISRMVNYILNEYGKAKQQEIELQKSLYANNSVLLELFDRLISKFSSAAKCREDMVRFVLRKAISSLRDSLRTTLNISSKAASLALCKRYFNIDREDDDVTLKELNVEDEDQLLNFLLPYKKNSRNKTANTCFMTEIFASDAFYKDYKEYLTKFDEILEYDNQKKVEKFVTFIEGCVKKNAINEIGCYKRLPWLKVWLDATKIIAFELLDTKTWRNANHRPKKAKTQKPKANKAKNEDQRNN